MKEKLESLRGAWQIPLLAILILILFNIEGNALFVGVTVGEGLISIVSQTIFEEGAASAFV
jgi:uncharacterized membrane protein